MRRLLAIPLVLLALLAGAVYWSGGVRDRPADFTFVNRGDIKTLDLVKMTYMQDIRVAYGLWEGLYTLDPQTLKPIPGAAGRIEVSDDQKTYTFHLRPEAKWSNGDPVLARDFVYAWRRMIDGAGEYGELHNYIRGVKAYAEAPPNLRDGRAALASGGVAALWEFAGRPGASLIDYECVTGVQLDSADPRKLTVTLENPTPFFPDLCAFPPFFPSNERSMMKRDEQTLRLGIPDDFTRAGKLVTNGPYKLDQWEFKWRLRLLANEHYWDAKNVKCKVIDMLVMDDPQTAFSAYESGVVDWVSDMAKPFGAELREVGLSQPQTGEGASRRRNRQIAREDLHIFNSFGTYFYEFNCLEKFRDGTPNPFHDVRVRKAFTMAVDKQYIVDYITRLGEPVALDYIPPGVFEGYESPKGIGFDAEAARRLLADAGYPDGQGFPLIKINFNTEEGVHKDIAEYLHRQWRQNLGVETELDGKEQARFSEDLRTKNYMISRASWIGDYQDPSTFTDKYRSTSGNNNAVWKNPKFDALCDRVTVEKDQRRRLELFHQAEAMLLDEAPIMPLYYYVNGYLYRPGVKNIPLNSKGMVMFQAIEVNR